MPNNLLARTARRSIADDDPEFINGRDDTNDDGLSTLGVCLCAMAVCFVVCSRITIEARLPERERIMVNDLLLSCFALLCVCVLYRSSVCRQSWNVRQTHLPTRFNGSVPPLKSATQHAHKTATDFCAEFYFTIQSRFRTIET